jgi:hypothetical protein
LGEEAFEHRSRFASFEVEDQLAVFVVLAHPVQGGDEVVGIKVLTGESNKTRSTVIREVDEDVVLFSGFEDLLSLLLEGFTSSEDVQEVLGSDISTRVVDLDSGINISSGSSWVSGLVEDLTREWVGLGVSNIVISESDDVVSFETVFNQTLISVEDIGLMSVVVVSVGTSNEDGITSSIAQSSEASESKENLDESHFCF